MDGLSGSYPHLEVVLRRRWFSFGPARNILFGHHQRCNRGTISTCIRHIRKHRRESMAKRGGEMSTAAEVVRVFALSDLHTDYPENMEWVKNLPALQYRNDILIVAGDVAETYNNFVLTMSILKDRFRQIFFVPGNHDVWCRREQGRYLDSLEKLNALLDACSMLGIDTSPSVVNDLGIVPLFSWYHESFDKERDITDVWIPPLEMACKDFHACIWPCNLTSKDLSLALHFDRMNVRYIHAVEEVQRKCSKIITFSHFIPRQELCPEKRMLFYPDLPKIIGSDCLEERLRYIHGAAEDGSACHIFGHTHFCWDALLDGIRYIQVPLAYPRERKRRMNGGEEWLPLCVYDSSSGGFLTSFFPCYWSDYYAKNERNPDVTELAPWVARFYKRR
ncbi:uncharacterized protein LOC116261375 [Nymphaea colorata]|nr:uncharacterized protein LOC116261375 [Nymphaea colorata]